MMKLTLKFTFCLFYWSGSIIY